MIQFSHELLLLWKDGEAIEKGNKGNSTDPFTMVITKQGGDYTVSVDGEVYLKHHDDKPLKGGQKVSIGGYLSKMYLGDVSITNLDGPEVKTEPKVEVKIDLSKAFAGQPASGAITLARGLNYKAVEAKPDVAYLTDRGYTLKDLPKEMVGGTLLVRDSGTRDDWLPADKVMANKDCTLYMAVLTIHNGTRRFTAAQLKSLADDGWQPMKEAFSTTVPKGENWVWTLFRIPVKKGVIDVPPSFKKDGGNRIFVIK